MHSSLYIARAAAEQFTTRQRKAAQQVAGGKLHPTAATELLRPWLAAACRCGADLPELTDLIADRQSKCTDGTWEVRPETARALVADEICPRPKLIAAITKRRDEALDALPAQGDPNSPQFTDASGINAMANYLGCKPYIPGCTESQRRAAA